MPELELRKARFIEVGDRVRWCGKICSVSSVSKIRASGLMLSFTINNCPITIEPEDIDLVVVEVKGHTTKTTTLKADDSLHCEPRVL
jgi:hypothetical protein